MLAFFTRNGHNHQSMAQARVRMVEEQLKGRGIRDERVLAAMSKVPREEFVSTTDAASAYGDYPLPIGAGQTISQPYIVASMLESLQLRAKDRVLEVGTGTGYQAAILAELSAEVWTVERQAELADKAQQILSRLNYGNVHVVQGDGSRGLPENSPYDKIVVAAAAPRVPDNLVTQLADGGVMVVPVGNRFEQQLQVVRKLHDRIAVTAHELCRFVPLVGEQGWEQ